MRVDVGACPDLLDRGADVGGVPERDRVEDEAKDAKLLLLPLVVRLADLAPLAMADGADQAVAGLVAVELGQDGSALALVVDVAEQVQGLDHAAELAQGARERGGAVLDLEHAHGGVGMDVPELERAGEPQEVVPMPGQSMSPGSMRWRASAFSRP